MGMGALMNSDECYVTLELPGGDVYTGRAAVASVNIDQPLIEYGDPASPLYLAGKTRWDMQLSGLSGLMRTDHKGHGKSVETYKGEPEWRCPYCGAINLRDTRHCDGCNAWRPWAMGGQ